MGWRVMALTSGRRRVDLLDDAGDRLRRAAGVLDGEAVEALGARGAEGGLHPGDLHHLAAEADEDRGADVRVGGVAPEDALEVVEAGAGGGHAAAGAVGEGDDAVDVGVVAEDAGGHHRLGGAADDGGGAVHRGADGDVVAGADLAVRAAVAHEGARGDLGDGGAGGLEVGADVVVLVVGAELAVLGVDVLAGGDGLGRVADDLAELGDGAAEGDVLAGDLVAGHDRAGELDAEAEGARALGRAGGQDRDVVGGVEDEGGGGGVEHGFGLAGGSG